MDRVLGLRVQGLLVGLLLAGGCASNPSNQVQAPRPPDPENIKEEPTPDIRPQTFVAAGDLAMTRNQYPIAQKQYEQALTMQPNDASTLRKLALSYSKSNQPAEAIETWQRFMKATDGSADAYGSLGYAYELAGNKTLAEQTYQAGIARHPQGLLIRNNYGLMLVRNERVEEAVKQMSVVLQPHEVNYNIAGVYKQLGRKDLAQFYYHRALECNPNFYAAKQKLATIDEP